MNEVPFRFGGAQLVARASGALWWPERALLVVADLHFGKSERVARRGGPLLPPWDAPETLDRLAAEIEGTGARAMVCLGDSFDDTAAAQALPEPVLERLAALMAGRDWTWVLGNHDPGPLGLGGSHRASLALGGLIFRHQAQGFEGPPEVSAHYHPKFALPGMGQAKPCFLYDSQRLILPAFGAYTGGLWAGERALSGLFRPPARAILTGRQMLVVPFAP